MKKPRYGHIDPSDTCRDLLDVARETDSQILCQWVPGHRNIIGNAEANAVANQCRIDTPQDTQLQLGIHPATLKTKLKQQEQQSFRLQIYE